MTTKVQRKSKVCKRYHNYYGGYLMPNYYHLEIKL